MTKIQSLRNEYEALTGEVVDKSVKARQLQRMINEKQSQIAREKTLQEQAIKQAQAEAEKAQRQADRDERIAARGTLEEFIEKHHDNAVDNYFSYALRSAQRTISQADATKSEFDKNFATDPAYAMSWSHNLFAMTAKAKVAKAMIEAWENGSTWEGWISRATEEAMRGAKHPQYSTSPTSNLMSQHLTAAWADAADQS